MLELPRCNGPNRPEILRKGSDLPPIGFSFITRVCRFEIGSRGWFHGKRAGRGAIRERKRPACFERCQVAERGVRPGSVVVVAPECDLAARVVQGVEELLIQQFITRAAVERLDEGVSRCGFPGSM